jgi:endonuclease/exonuclease/phosphatase family metal-dependent hydrolase
MTVVLTWNIQSGIGCDGVTDLGRIAETIGAYDPDVICLQEVAQHMPEFGDGADQAAELDALFPDHESFFGAAFDRAGGQGGRARFGNMILSRLPVLQFFAHPLPQPAVAGVKHMPRQASEAVVETPGGALRIVTTHFEYHSEVHRIAQAEHLRMLQTEAEAREACPGLDPGAGPYALVPRPVSALYCGDFNAGPGDAVHSLMTVPLASGRCLRDVWVVANGDEPHAPTTGIFDRKQWPQGPHCRDYFFVSEEVSGRIGSVAVNVGTDQSDHQPVIIALR